MSRDLQCSLLSSLVAQHQYGQPIQRDQLLRITSYPSHQGGDAKQSFEELRRERFIIDHRNRGIMLDSSEFGRLAQYLYEEWENLDLE
jgi:hypothetical protein